MLRIILPNPEWNQMNTFSLFAVFRLYTLSPSKNRNRS
jgi:hypothetical protein